MTFWVKVRHKMWSCCKEYSPSLCLQVSPVWCLPRILKQRRPRDLKNIVVRLTASKFHARSQARQFRTPNLWSVKFAPHLLTLKPGLFLHYNYINTSSDKHFNGHRNSILLPSNESNPPQGRQWYLSLHRVVNIIPECFEAYGETAPNTLYFPCCWKWASQASLHNVSTPQRDH